MGLSAFVEAVRPDLAPDRAAFEALLFRAMTDPAYEVPTVFHLDLSAG